MKGISAGVVRCGLCLLVWGQLAFGQADQAPKEEPAPKGTVLFSSDQAATEKARKDAATEQAEVVVSDAERDSLTFTAYNLDAHIVPAKSRLAMRATFTVRNSGTEPLKRLVFQVSSSLSWESFALRQTDQVKQLTFVQHVVDTDADHTGKAQEAVVTLPEPLATGASIELTAFYSGEVEQSANRLERIGAPIEQAANADWDRITTDRTALRGFGDVLWYPTASAPVFLGDGAKLFQAVGRTKLEQAAATIRLRLTVEYVGDPPDAAYFCGRREPLTAVSENVNALVSDAPGVATAEFPERLLGFRVPSLFVTDRAATMSDGNLIAAVTDHYDAVPNYAAAAVKVEPLLKEWLGPTPLSVLTVLDQDGQPFEDDALLVAPMRATDPAVLAPTLLHSLSHAWFSSSHVWLDEGVPQFMGLLWTEQSEGRDVALKTLQQRVNTLAMVEPPPSQKTDDAQTGQSLISARDDVYYRTKAAAVLWMLRSIAGGDALKHALQTYRHDKRLDEDPKGFERALERASNKDLAWFFDDWVYRDRGLPDLTIANVAPRELPARGDKAASWLVAVEVRNDGDAVADVPVTVRSGELSATERLRVTGRSSASVRILFEGRPEEVVVNDGGVPEVSAPSHRRRLE